VALTNPLIETVPDETASSYCDPTMKYTVLVPFAFGTTSDMPFECSQFPADPAGYEKLMAPSDCPVVLKKDIERVPAPPASPAPESTSSVPFPSVCTLVTSPVNPPTTGCGEPKPEPDGCNCQMAPVVSGAAP
jgi:hypothetical protein